MPPREAPPPSRDPARPAMPTATGRAARYAEAVALALLLFALAAISWRRWPDLLVDFGQQLYIPWRLAAGARLHRDILFLHGPLSQHFNALLFRLFGASYSVLIASNLALVAILTWLVRRAVRRAADHATARVAAVVFLALFAFAHYVFVGNYNYISPYTHEATHGTLLAVGLVLALGRYAARGRRRDAALAGVLLGLAAMTKVEVAMAALATTVVALVVVAAVPLPAGRRRGGVMILAGLALLPGIAFFIYFCTYLAPLPALRAAAAGFVSLSGEVARNPFYRHVLGLDDVRHNLLAAADMTAWIAIAAGAAAGADLLARRLPLRPVQIALAAGTLLFLALVAWPDLVPWMELPRALPVVAAVLVVVFSLRVARFRADPGIARRHVPMLLLAVFGLAMLGKSALNTHLYHYGFYLAMPATLAATAAALYWGPRAVRAAGGSGVVARGLAFAFVAAAIVYHLRWSWAIYAQKDLPVGGDGDTILTYGPTVQENGTVTAEALDWIVSHTPPSSTLLGLPEGIMLNYLARRETTTPCMNFMMTEMILFGEDRLLQGLEARPPDYVALVHKKTDEFGVGPFGADPRYGRKLVEWIDAHYDPVARFGAEPFRGDAFGIRILRRREAAPSAATGAP